MSAAKAAQIAGGLIFDPFKAYDFRVIFIPTLGKGIAGKAVSAAAGTIASVLAGGFTSVTGLGWKTDVRTVREGGVNDREYKLPGPTTCNQLVLSKGMTLLDPMWEWYSLAVAGRVQRMNGVIFLMTDLHAPTAPGSRLPTTGAPVAIWHFTRAWPTALDGVQFDASQSLLAVQSMTLAIESIKKTASIGSWM